MESQNYTIAITKVQLSFYLFIYDLKLNSFIQLKNWQFFVLWTKRPTWLKDVILFQANPGHSKSEPNERTENDVEEKKSLSPFESFPCSSSFLMGTILPPHSLSPPLLNIKPSSSLQPKSNSVFCSKPIVSSLKKNQTLSLNNKPSLPSCTSWLVHAQQGLAALAISLALNFTPLLHSGNALASEFDVLNEGPPKESYVVDDAGVLSRVTRSDLKRLLSDLESRKNIHINFITVRKLTVSSFCCF